MDFKKARVESKGGSLTSKQLFGCYCEEGAAMFEEGTGGDGSVG
jgi:hypothetical protein